MRTLSASSAQSPLAVVTLTAETAPEIAGLVKVAERRISRTVFEYEYQVDVKAKLVDLYSVSVRLVSAGPGTVVVRGTATLGDLGRLKTGRTSESIAFRHDRSLPFSISTLVWQFSAYKPIATSEPVVQTLEVEPGVRVGSGEFIVFAGVDAPHGVVVNLLESLGWTVVGHSAVQKSYQVRVPNANTLETLRQAAAQLVGSSLIEGVSLNPMVSSLSYPVSDPVASLATGNRKNWPFRAIEAYEAWDNVYAGVPDNSLPLIPIAIVDRWFESGETDLDVSVSLASNLDPSDSDTRWSLSHGNFVAGIIGARADSFLTLGIAHRRVALSGYKLSFVRSFGVSLTYDAFTMLGGIESAVNDGAKIVNLSMGGGFYDDCTAKSVSDIVKSANGRVLFINAAGNDAEKGSPHFADGSRSSPFGFAATLDRGRTTAGFFDIACRKRTAAEVLEIRQHTLIVGSFAPDVGHTLSLDALIVPSYSEVPNVPGSFFQNPAGKVDFDEFFPYLLAPGGELRSGNDPDAMVTSNARPFSNMGYSWVGTSFAAPHVAGVAALMMQANSALSAAEVRDLILLSARKRCTDGYLVLNAARAVVKAKTPDFSVSPVCEAPVVTNASCTAPVVGVAMVCTVTGSRLPESTTFSATNCSPNSMTAVPGGDEAKKQFRCIPLSSGVPVEVSYIVPGFIGPYPIVPPVIAAPDPAAVDQRFGGRWVGTVNATGSLDVYDYSLDLVQTGATVTGTIYISHPSGSPSARFSMQGTITGGSLAFQGTSVLESNSSAFCLASGSLTLVSSQGVLQLNGTYGPLAVPNGCPSGSSGSILLRKVLNLSTFFQDEFEGIDIDASKWTRVLHPNYSGTSASVSGGELRLAVGAWLHTQGKATFTGRKIVIEGVMGDTEASILLMDSFDAVTGQSAGTIMGSETLYRGWGFSVQAGGRYPIVGPTTSGSITVAEGQNVLVSWEHNPSMAYRRMTVDGDVVTFERGDSANSITRHLSTRLAASISGRPLTLVLGTGVGPYTPGRFQWIRVTVTP